MSIFSGSDHAPISNSLSQEPIPKSVARVLNAAKVQEEWRAKKRKLETGEQEGQINGKPAKKKRMASDAGEDRVESMKIQSGESLAHFNRYDIISTYYKCFAILITSN